MAKTFTLTSGAYQGRYLQLYCVQTPDIANNRSTINWTLSSLGGESNYYSTGPTTVTIAGNQVYYCPKMEWNTYQFPAAKGSVSGSLTVNHDTYGNLTISVSMSANIYTGVLNTYSNNWTLDSIPRQATITAAYDFTDVDNPRITFSNPGGFPMAVWLEPNPNGDHLCIREGIPNTGSYTWELTDEERNALRARCAGNSCKIRLGLYSYVASGETFADYKDMTYTMTENEATKPSVSMEVVLDNGTLPSTFDGICVQGKSRVHVSISADGKYGANIRSYWANVDGKGYLYLPFTSDVIQSAGSVTVSGFAKDSREFTGSDERAIQVVEYSKPLVIPAQSNNAILCYRSDGKGTRTGNSTSVWIKVARSYHYVMGKNFCALEWRRKLATEEWDDTKHQWSVLLSKDSLATDVYDDLLSGVEFDLQEAYTVQVRAIDDIGESDTKTLEVPTRDVALHLGRGGKNVSVGTYCDYSEDYTFYSEWKAIFDKEVVIGGDIFIGPNKTTLRDYILSVINGGG